jgi:hypothetical protein
MQTGGLLSTTCRSRTQQVHAAMLGNQFQRKKTTTPIAGHSQQGNMDFVKATCGPFQKPWTSETFTSFKAPFIGALVCKVRSLERGAFCRVRSEVQTRDAPHFDLGS